MTGETAAIRENGATSGVGVLASFAYDALGRRTGVSRAGGAGASTGYGWDGLSRLSSLSHDASGTGSDQTWTFAHNPAGQIVEQTASNAAWKWSFASNYSDVYTSDGLNKYLTAAGASLTYDGRGNLTYDGSKTFAYDADNRLVSGSGGATLGYDPVGRLYEVAVSGGATTRGAAWSPSPTPPGR